MNMIQNTRKIFKQRNQHIWNLKFHPGSAVFFKQINATLNYNFVVPLALDDNTLSFSRNVFTSSYVQQPDGLWLLGIQSNFCKDRLF